MEFLKTGVIINSEQYVQTLKKLEQRIRQVAGTCECGEEPSGSIKHGEFLDQLQTS